MRRVQRGAGISEAELRAIEKAKGARFQRDGDKQLWRTQIEQVDGSHDLDELAAAGLTQLLRLVSPTWLQAEAQKAYRLESTFLTNPLHLVNGCRVGVGPAQEGPQRLARMLLVTQDHLDKRWDLDFFSAALLVPEGAVLGNSLSEIRALGPEAERKLAALPRMTDEEVSATIYELLVGAACVRNGRSITMVPEDRSRKVPDFCLSDLGPLTGAIECKRRLGLTVYELAEARYVEALYGPVRTQLRDRGIHGSLEACFTVPLGSVQVAEFSEAVLAIVDDRAHEVGSTQTRWGSLAFRPHRQLRAIQKTRLYSPDYLQEAFDWDPLQDQWDGLLCEVDPVPNIRVELITRPLCLKWRSETEEALTKKARGVTSLWANAARQIPDGEIGFIYIAYPEGARPTLADARTRHILSTASNDFFHRWSVRIPAMVVTRLYARALGVGVPDLIENAMAGSTNGEEFWFEQLPGRVFTEPISPQA